jgi:hypothetical protein
MWRRATQTVVAVATAVQSPVIHQRPVNGARIVASVQHAAPATGFHPDPVAFDTGRT